MGNYIMNYLITFSVFIVIDLLWLGLVARDFYRSQIGFIMADKTNVPAAFLFYSIYIAGILFFVIQPALAKGSWIHALSLGLFFGFITYSTYDLTNLATLKNWPLKVTIVDLLWGTALGGLVASMSFLIIRWLN